MPGLLTNMHNSFPLLEERIKAKARIFEDNMRPHPDRLHRINAILHCNVTIG